MRKSIALTPNATKWSYIISGTINLALGISHFLKAASLTNWESIVGAFIGIAGILVILFGVFSSNPANKLMPMVQVDETCILVKEDLHKRERKIDWKNIKEITYKSFELDFLLDDNNREIINLRTNGEISIEIKKTIRRFAGDRQIKIIGG